MREKKLSAAERARGSVSGWRELTQEEWARIEPLCPEITRPHRQKVSNQQMVNALLYRRYTKIPWKELPEQFGPWQAVVKRFTRWRDDGAVQRIFDELEQMGLLPEVVVEVGEAPLDWWELTNEHWEVVEKLLLPEPQKVYGNSRYKKNRAMLNAIIYREITDCAWRDIPEKAGHWKTVNNHYTKWKADGTLQRVFDELQNLGIISEVKKFQPQEEPQTEEFPREWWELTDEQWERILPVMPPEIRHNKGKKPKTNRQMLDAILCRYRTDTHWLKLPKKYGHWRTVNDRYKKWKADGSLQRILAELEKMGVIVKP